MTAWSPGVVERVRVSVWRDGHSWEWEIVGESKYGRAVALELGRSWSEGKAERSARSAAEEMLAQREQRRVEKRSFVVA